MKQLNVCVGMTLAEVERLLLVETLAECKNNKSAAAEMLGISLKSVYNKLYRVESGYVLDDEPQVYAARDDHRSLMKIGWSRNPTGRLKNIKTASGVALRLVLTRKAQSAFDARRIEWWLHRQFKNRRQESEWYDDADLLISNTLPAEMERACQIL